MGHVRNFSRKAVKHEDESAVERILEIKKEEKIKIYNFIEVIQKILFHLKA